MNSSKRALLIIVASFLVPVLLGSLAYIYRDNLGMGTKTVNYGTLIQPARPTEPLDLQQDDKAADAKEVLQGKWTLLQIAPPECSQLCQDHLLLMKRVRLLMNDKMRRIRTVLVTHNGQADNASMKEKYPDLVLTNTNSATSTFVQQFEPHDMSSAAIYLLDPLGNLMMVYPQADPDAKKIIKDLKRLLKYSRLG